MAGVRNLILPFFCTGRSGEQAYVYDTYTVRFAHIRPFGIHSDACWTRERPGRETLVRMIVVWRTKNPVVLFTWKEARRRSWRLPKV